MIFKKYIGDKAFYQKVLTITIPILIQNVITNFVSLLDNVMVGRLGTEPMSGVAIVNQLLFIFNLCIFGGISGAGIFAAQYHGTGDVDGVRNTFRMKALIVLVLTVIALIIFALCGPQLISMFLHEGEESLDLAATLAHGKKYMYVMLVSLLPFAVCQIYAGTLKETGETMLPMKAGIIAVFVNLCLNYILIYGKLGMPAMGVVGAAVATLIARVVECLIVALWTHKHKEKAPYIKGVYSNFRVPRELASKVLRKGLPLMVNEGLWSLGMTALTQCYSIRGLEAISASNISSTVSNLFFCAVFAFANAISIIVGHLLGSGDIERAKDEDSKLIFCAIVICTVIGGALAICAPFIPQIYNTSDGIRDLATKFLLVSAAMMPFNCFIHATYFTFRAGGQTVLTFVFDSVFIWCICYPVAFCLSRFTNMPIFPLFLTIHCIELIKVVLGAWLLKRGTWAKNLVND